MEKKVENKKPRSIVLSENWKKKEIQKVLLLRDEMIENNIDKILIKKYIDEQYDLINEKYEQRIQKYYNSINIIKQTDNSNLNSIHINPVNKKKREKAVDFLLKNKTFLENNGASQEFINNYVNKQYNLINKTYNESNTNLNPDDINLDNVNFID